MDFLSSKYTPVQTIQELTTPILSVKNKVLIEEPETDPIADIMAIINAIPTSFREEDTDGDLPKETEQEEITEEDKKKTFTQILQEEGVDVRTSRDYVEGAKTAQGKTSNHGRKTEHGHPGAYDIIPKDGDFDKLRAAIYGNRRVKDWLASNKFGILEEITPEMMKKTRATGKHFHVGPDSEAVESSIKNGVRYAQQGMKFQEEISMSPFLNSVYQPVEYLTPNKPILSGLEMLKTITDTPVEQKIDEFNPIKEITTSLNAEASMQQMMSSDANQLNIDPSAGLLKSSANSVEKDEAVKYKAKETASSKEIINRIKELIPDEKKATALVKIAAAESNFNPQAKNPTSTAFGLFQFIASNQRAYGYGKSIDSQILAASKLYDDEKNKLDKAIAKHGSRGHSYDELIYGMWFSPANTLSYLKSGNNGFKDAQGTGLNTIFKKMRDYTKQFG